MPPLVAHLGFIMVKMWQILQVSLFIANGVVSKCSNRKVFPKCWKTFLNYSICSASISAWKPSTISHVNPIKNKNFRKRFNTILYESKLHALFSSNFKLKKKMHIITVNAKDRTLSKYLGDGFRNTRMVLREWFQTWSFLKEAKDPAF